MKQTDSGIGYELSRTYSVAPDVLFHALTDAAVLKQIWGVQEIAVDARPGGKAEAQFVAEGIRMENFESASERDANRQAWEKGLTTLAALVGRTM
jgi:Activator of Hsp90 ATPase homolog 1-like protein